LSKNSPHLAKYPSCCTQRKCVWLFRTQRCRQNHHHPFIVRITENATRTAKDLWPVICTKQDRHIKKNRLHYRATFFIWSSYRSGESGYLPQDFSTAQKQNC